MFHTILVPLDGSAFAEQALPAALTLVQAQSLAVETQIMVHSHAPTAIIAEAESQHCDVIALATHGRGGLSRLLLGSVADKVLRSSSLPVLVYHSKGAGEA